LDELLEGWLLRLMDASSKEQRLWERSTCKLERNWRERTSTGERIRKIPL